MLLIIKFWFCPPNSFELKCSVSIMSHVTGRYKVAFTQISPFTQSSTTSAFTYTWSDLIHELAEPHSVRLFYGVACRSAVMEESCFSHKLRYQDS